MPIINTALTEREVKMTSSILKNLGIKEFKRVRKSNVWEARQLLEHGKDIAIDPKTGIVYTVPVNY